MPWTFELVVIVGHLANSCACEARQNRWCRCGKTGHLHLMYQSSGHSAKVQQVDNESSSHSGKQTVCVVKECKHCIYASVFMEGQAVLFLVNTGSSVAILTEELYRRCFAGTLPLKPTAMQLFDYSHSKIRVQGCFAASVTSQGRNACILLKAPLCWA